MKIYAIICLFFINLALITISQIPTATSYEISIFSAYPLFVWGFFFIALALGIFIILSSYQKKWKIFGVLICFYLNLIFISLPFLRNYILYGRADVTSHISYITEIILENHIGVFNYYPIAHLFAVNLHYYTNINVNTIILIIPAIFLMIYLAGLYLFAKEITKKKAEAVVVLIFGFVLMFSYYTVMFLPTQLSFFLVPMILYLLFKSKKISSNNLSYSVLFLILLMIMPFFHPLTSINLIFIILLIGCSILITWIIDDNSIFETKRLINPLLLLCVSFFTWISSKTIFNSNVKRIYNWLVNEVGTPTIDNYMTSLSFSNLGIIEIINKILLTYGAEIVYVCVALISIGFLIHDSVKKRRIEHSTFFLLSGFVIFTLLSALFLLGAYGISNPLREFVYVLLFATIINGIFFYRFICSKNISKRYSTYLLILFIVPCSVMGLYSSYYSVSAGETNLQVTNAEFSGMGWFYTNWDSNSRIYDLDKSSRRFSDVYNGINFTKTKSWMFKLAPIHFNFTNETGYLVLNQYVTDRYSNYWTDNPYFQNNDFNSLDSNTRLNRIYDNADNEIWSVRKI